MTMFPLTRSMVSLALLGAGMCCLGGLAMAQPETPPNASEAQPAPTQDPAATTGEQPPAEQPAPPPPAQAPAGDVIHLKSGKDLKGVQVVRRNATGFVVELFENVAPIVIPHSQILSIDFDNFDPVKDRREREKAAADAAQGIQGLRLSPELNKALNSAIGEPPLVFDAVDVIQAVAELSSRLSVTIEADASLNTLPPMARMWTTQAAPDVSLLTLLRDDLLVKLPEVGIVYRFDKIVVMSKPAAEAAQKEQSEPASPDAPPAEPEPPAQPAPAPAN